MHIINPYRFSAGGGGGISSPEDVSGLFLWLDATDTSYLWKENSRTTQVSANNDAVGNWRNKATGGGSEDFSASSSYDLTYKTNVQNGLAACYADGAGALIHSSEISAFTGDFTFFIVAAQDAGETEAWSNPFTTNSSLATCFRPFFDTRNSPRRLASYNSSGVAAYLDLLSEQSPGWKLMSATYDVGVKAEAFLDGTSQDSATSNITACTSSANIIGAASSVGAGGIVGHIGEILAYNSVLSSTDRQSVETYLMNRWGIS